ncbi:MAG: tRNA pseudouridine(38-40) synthase TruA [Microbacteriaceae bacterium]|nr:tRNA pseudouridine(38-40) synthase TruA [Microbacteriaceae bacterium]
MDAEALRLASLTQGAGPSSGGVRVRLDLGYDGAAFSGWARQAEGRTVQGELEQALATLFRGRGAAPRIVVAGRTDAGVHARGQVAHLDLDPAQWRHLGRMGHGAAAETTLVRKLNGLAGAAGDVRVHRATPAPDGFDARFSAVWRRYEYRVADPGAAQDPLARAFTVWHPRPLDAVAMDAAARLLAGPGLADWAAYCRPRAGSTTIRDLQSFAWTREADGVLVARLQADAFCHSMVRALVGACVAVGEGVLGTADPLALREAGGRTSAFKVMPAKGLVLTEVGYPPPEELAARARQTRGLRSLDPDE